MKLLSWLNSPEWGGPSPPAGRWTWRRCHPSVNSNSTTKYLKIRLSDCKRVHHVTNAVRHPVNKRPALNGRAKSFHWFQNGCRDEWQWRNVRNETVKQVLKNKSMPRSQWWDSVLLLYSARPEAVISHIAVPTRLSEQKYLCTTSRHSLLAATCCILLHMSNTGNRYYFIFVSFSIQQNNRSCTSLLKSGQSCAHITWSQCRMLNNILIIQHNHKNGSLKHAEWRITIHVQ